MLTHRNVKQRATNVSNKTDMSKVIRCLLEDMMNEFQKYWDLGTEGGLCYKVRTCE